jgi:hypothetical protein
MAMREEKCCLFYAIASLQPVAFPHSWKVVFFELWQCSFRGAIWPHHSTSFQIFTDHPKTLCYNVWPTDSAGNKWEHKYVPYRNVERTVSQLCTLVTPHWNTSLRDSRNVALFSSSSGWHALSTTHSSGSHSHIPKLYRMIKNSLCTWWLQYKKHAKIF